MCLYPKNRKQKQVVEFCKANGVERVSKLTGNHFKRFRREIIFKATDEFRPLSKAGINAMLYELAKLFEVDFEQCQAVFERDIDEACRPDIYS